MTTKYQSIKADVKKGPLSREAKEILTEFLKVDGIKNEKELLIHLGWFTVGMLSRAESEKEPCELGNELQDYITHKLHPYTTEDAILQDLWDPLYWGIAKSPVKAADYIRDELRLDYDETLVKSIAQEMLYGRGTNLLRYA